MKDSNNFFTQEEGALVGYIETDSGTVLLTDGLWKSQLPATSQSCVDLDLGIERCRIPVYGTLRNDKRFLIISIDDAEYTAAGDETIETEEQVAVPEREEEKELGEGEDNG